MPLGDFGALLRHSHPKPLLASRMVVTTRRRCHGCFVQKVGKLRRGLLQLQRCVDDEAHIGPVGHGEAHVLEHHEPGRRMIDPLVQGRWVGHLMSRPPGAELVARRHKGRDETLEFWVAGIMGAVGAEHGQSRWSQNIPVGQQGADGPDQRRPCA